MHVARESANNSFINLKTGVDVTWKGATDGGGAANQLRTVGNAHLREPGAGGDDREILLGISIECVRGLCCERE